MKELKRKDVKNNMIREEFRGEEWQFPFVMYRPTQMKDNLPLVVQLHGAGEAGNGMDELCKVDVYGFSHLLTEEADYQCIFVMPQYGGGTFWPAEVPNIYAFICSVMQKYNVDEKRVYLTGLSMGGYGTWYTAQRYPNLFAAIAPVCGAGIVWLSFVLDMDIWAFHGSEDEVVLPTETTNMIHQIRKWGVNKKEVKMTILDNVEHNAWDYAYTPELLEWLLSKSR